MGSSWSLVLRIAARVPVTNYKQMKAVVEQGEGGIIHCSLPIAPSIFPPLVLVLVPRGYTCYVHVGSGY